MGALMFANVCKVYIAFLESEYIWIIELMDLAVEAVPPGQGFLAWSTAKSTTKSWKLKLLPCQGLQSGMSNTATMVEQWINGRWNTTTIIVPVACLPFLFGPGPPFLVSNVRNLPKKYQNNLRTTLEETENYKLLNVSFFMLLPLCGPLVPPAGCRNRNLCA